ncbi:DEAD/DEAH box helicase [Sutterella wadsworthensis]|uniref:DEAD/DEAH box helicase n=1 Tax=Sutterella wadsworthensis TaxID=40545 RepID=UPI000DEB455C|nr:DEAD/DEAH box helicase [Sutterella wadsworthensis]QQS88826.1 ATP-binding protein [Sutterella wadsworthensis]RBP52586.1 AAA domain-containing protein [Sutterella wadsworthensis]
MLSRAEQIDVLRYWEEIELLTPPDYRVVENERLLVCEWKSGRPAGREAEAIAKWQKERWQEPFEYPERAPRGVVTDTMPVFMVYVGILPKGDVYRRLIDEMKAFAAFSAGHSGTAASAAKTAPSGWNEEWIASSAEGGSYLRGSTLLAAFMLNPWGKYIDESIHVAGYVGALEYLRSMRTAVCREDAPPMDFITGAQMSCAKLARQVENNIAQTLRQAAGVPGAFLNAERFKSDAAPGEVANKGEQRRGESDWIRLTDPHEEAEPVPEGLIAEIGRFLILAAGFPENSIVTVSAAVRFCRPSERRLPDGSVFMESFYLHDIRQAHSELEQAGVKPFGAPDFVRYAAHLQASSEKVGEEGLPSKNTNVETVDEEAAAPPESEAFAAPIGAPLARLLACAADEKLPRIDLLKEPFVVADLASPRSLASGRWPTNAAHHLYLCQQAAMAGILRMGPNSAQGFGPLVSVNGPPGTGKSWLVRDLVAEIVVRRARKIAGKNYSREVFDDQQSVTFNLPGGRSETFTPFARDVIKDSFILVASNNNAAIRNITDALPRSYTRRPNVTDDRSAAGRPAYTYWRDCALGVFAHAAGIASGKKNSQKGAEAAVKRLSADAERSLQEMRNDMLGRINRPEMVWGLVSATLGSRRNCQLIARSVLGVGGRNIFGSQIQNQIDDWVRECEFRHELPEDVWMRAREAFLELDCRVEERRQRMTERLSRMAPPLAFQKPLSEDPQQHKSSLWVDEEFENLRSELFEAALTLHAATLGAQSDWAKKGFRAVGVYLTENAPSFTAGSGIDIFEFLSFLIPVLSTTLASTSRLLAHVNPGEIAWVIIDEASQASAQSAVGLLNRAERAVVLGDPRQLMPVVSMPQPLDAFLRSRYPSVDRLWSPHVSSLQSLADQTMEVGALIHDPVAESDVWTGLPLRTHRRCQSPMFEIANTLSYGGQMVQMTPRSDDGTLVTSCWIDILGHSYEPPARRNARGRAVTSVRGDPKVIREEMAWLRHCILRLKDNVKFFGRRVYILSPFRSVADAAARILREIGVTGANGLTAVGQKVEIRAGTVHAFQGQEADIVFLVLGSVPGIRGHAQRRWAALPANLINVAVTRAKSGLVVVGDWGEWTLERTFAIMAESLERRPVTVAPNAIVFRADQNATQSAAQKSLFDSEKSAEPQKREE